MASNSEAEEILRLALEGIPRVAQVIANVPTEHHKRAFDAAESSYRQTVKKLGYEGDDAERWVAALMLRLRTEVVGHGVDKLQLATHRRSYLRLVWRPTKSTEPSCCGTAPIASWR